MSDDKSNLALTLPVTTVLERLNARLKELEEIGNFHSRRVAQLEAGIRKHRDQRGDDRCWLDDVELYKLIGVVEGPAALPPRDKFLANCSRYYDARCRNADWPSYQELEAMIKAKDEALLLARRFINGDTPTYKVYETIDAALLMKRTKV